MGSGCFKAPHDSKVHPTPLSIVPDQPATTGASSSSTAPPPEFTSDVISSTGTNAKQPPGAAPTGPRKKPKPTLIKAAKDGNLEVVEELLKEPNCDIEKLGMWDNTPLLVAASYGHSKLALRLLEANANFLAKNEHGACALHYAAVEGSTTLVEALLAVASKSAKEVGTPEVQVFVNCDPVLIYNRHLDAYAPRTPLASAAESGFSEIVSILAAAGASLEASSEEDGCTPLWLACRYTRLPTVRTLLELKANIETKDNKGHSALGAALVNCSEDLVTLLLESGLRDPNDTADLPALSAVKAGRRGVVEVLLAHGAHAQPLSDRPAVAPLHLACEKGDEALISMLARAGADPERKNLAGQTAQDILVRRGTPQSHIAALFRPPPAQPKPAENAKGKASAGAAPISSPSQSKPSPTQPAPAATATATAPAPSAATATAAVGAATATEAGKSHEHADQPEAPSTAPANTSPNRVEEPEASKARERSEEIEANQASECSEQPEAVAPAPLPPLPAADGEPSAEAAPLPPEPTAA